MVTLDITHQVVLLYINYILSTTDIIVNCFCSISSKSTLSSRCRKENAVSTLYHVLHLIEDNDHPTCHFQDPGKVTAATSFQSVSQDIKGRILSFTSKCNKAPAFLLLVFSELISSLSSNVIIPPDIKGTITRSASRFPSFS